MMFRDEISKKLFLKPPPKIGWGVTLKARVGYDPALLRDPGPLIFQSLGFLICKMGTSMAAHLRCFKEGKMREMLVAKACQTSAS